MYNSSSFDFVTKSLLTRYCQLKDMGVLTADVFRNIKRDYGNTVIGWNDGKLITFNEMQKLYEKTRIEPYKDLIKLLK